MKKVIVTGANGFVGSAVCKELSKNGIKITAVVRNKQSNIERIKNIRNLKIIYCDMASYKDLASVVKERDYDCFYHFAWNGSAGALRGDYNVQLDNVRFSCDSVEAAKILGCKRYL